MKNRGFTLIELLAVIVIISILVIIVSVSVTPRVKKARDDLYNAQIESILSSTEMWVADNIENLPLGCNLISLKDLQDGGYVSSTIKNPNTKSAFNPYTTIKIMVTEENHSLNFTYEFDPSDISNCNNFS